MLALIKTVLLAVAALLGAAAACAFCVFLYPAFGFPLFALACAELIWLLVVGLAIPVVILDAERDWIAISIVPLSLVLIHVYSDFILYLAMAWGIALDQFTDNILRLSGRAVGAVVPHAPALSRPIAGGSGAAAPLAWLLGSTWTVALGAVSGILAALVVRTR